MKKLEQTKNELINTLKLDAELYREPTIVDSKTNNEKFKEFNFKGINKQKEKLEKIEGLTEISNLLQQNIETFNDKKKWNSNYKKNKDKENG